MKIKQQEKDKRRETAYPYYFWPHCVKLAQAIRDAGGDRSDVSRAVLAHQLGVAEDKPSLSQMIASAKTLGMIEGYGAYRLTATARQYFFPADDAEKRRAELSFLNTPSAFKKLILRFDGNILPPLKTLAHLMLRDGDVPKSWASRAAAIFGHAVEMLGIVDKGGHLRFATAMIQPAVPPPAVPSPSPEPKASPFREMPLPTEQRHMIPVGTQPGTTNDRAEGQRNVWVYTEAGATVRLETPDRLSKALWERLKKYVDVLEPSETKEGS